MKVVPDKISKRLRPGNGPAAAEEDNSEPTPLTRAQEAVSRYEGMRTELDEMEKSFEETYPEANAELVEMRRFKDEVVIAISTAKELVRDAGKTVGPFKFTPRMSKAGYDPDQLLNICINNNDGELLIELARTGALTIKLDRDTTNLYFDTNKEQAEKVEVAWKDRSPMTPAVTVPKL